MNDDDGAAIEYRVIDTHGTVVVLHARLNVCADLATFLTMFYDGDAPYTVQQADVLRIEGATLAPIVWEDVP